MPLPLGAVQCPDEWEYKTHPSYDPSLIAAISRRWLSALRQHIPDQRLKVCLDTRPLHKDLFQLLAPISVPYFAGHYRGEAYFCLENSRVIIPSDPRVGAPPNRVVRDIHKFNLAIQQATRVLQYKLANPTRYSSRQVIVQMAGVVAAAFVEFLTIHPFVNGNGHTARFILNALFGVFGFWIISSFPVHQHPPSMDYDTMIFEFRSGNRAPLIMFLLNCLK